MEERKEYSAGGIVIDENKKVLLIEVRNLSGAVVWTFPKGHIEQGESPEKAALREVLEETGYSCEILGRIGAAQYRFTDKKGLAVFKSVEWFTMKPLEKNREHDESTISTRWAVVREAQTLISYDSDKINLEKVRNNLNHEHNNISV